MDGREDILAARARRAYETGRLVLALRGSALLLPLAAVALACGTDPRVTLLSGALLALCVAFFLWRGGEFRRGVRPGLTAGAAPLLVALFCPLTTHICTGGLCLLLPVVCALGGLAGGVALGVLAPLPSEGRGVPLLVASILAGLTGALGCLLYGVIGIAGMIAGLLAGAVPVVASRRA